MIDQYSVYVYMCVCVCVSVGVLPPEERVYPRLRKRLSKTVLRFSELLQQRDPMALKTWIFITF